MNKFKAIKKASILGAIGNLFLLIIKAVVGFISHSHAMIADALNSAVDIFSSVMTFIGNKIASKPIDDDHNLGHGKAEYIYSLFISLIMFIMVYNIFKNSLIALISKEKLIYSVWLIIICLITILTKLILFIYTNYLNKKYKNILLKAASKDHRNDCLITLLNLSAIILSKYNIYFIDSIVGIIIGTWIFISALNIFIESYDVLMDKSINEETKDKVYKIIKKHEEIEKINHFNATPIGYQYQISFTIFVDGNLSTFKSHEIANNLEKEISKKIPEIFLTVIHVNPIENSKEITGVD